MWSGFLKLQTRYEIKTKSPSDPTFITTRNNHYWFLCILPENRYVNTHMAASYTLFPAYLYIRMCIHIY